MPDQVIGVILVIVLLGGTVFLTEYIQTRRDRAARLAVKQRDYYHSPAAQRLRAIHDGAKR